MLCHSNNVDGEQTSDNACNHCLFEDEDSEFFTGEQTDAEESTSSTSCSGSSAAQSIEPDHHVTIKNEKNNDNLLRTQPRPVYADDSISEEQSQRSKLSCHNFKNREEGQNLFPQPQQRSPTPEDEDKDETPVFVSDPRFHIRTAGKTVRGHRLVTQPTWMGQVIGQEPISAAYRHDDPEDLTMIPELDVLLPNQHLDMDILTALPELEDDLEYKGEDDDERILYLHMSRGYLQPPIDDERVQRKPIELEPHFQRMEMRDDAFFAQQRTLEQQQRVLEQQMAAVATPPAREESQRQVQKRNRDMVDDDVDEHEEEQVAPKRCFNLRPRRNAGQASREM